MRLERHEPRGSSLPYPSGNLALGLCLALYMQTNVKRSLSESDTAWLASAISDKLCRYVPAAHFKSITTMFKERESMAMRVTFRPPSKISDQSVPCL